MGVPQRPGRGGDQPGGLARIVDQLGHALGKAAPLDQLHDAVR
jgi:hypothetical protein